MNVKQMSTTRLEELEQIYRARFDDGLLTTKEKQTWSAIRKELHERLRG